MEYEAVRPKTSAKDVFENRRKSKRKLGANENSKTTENGSK
jgi:hypothetical protein